MGALLLRDLQLQLRQVRGCGEAQAERPRQATTNGFRDLRHKNSGQKFGKLSSAKARCQILELILPNYHFSGFPIFAVKLESL